MAGSGKPTGQQVAEQRRLADELWPNEYLTPKEIEARLKLRQTPSPSAKPEDKFEEETIDPNLISSEDGGNDQPFFDSEDPDGFSLGGLISETARAVVGADHTPGDRRVRYSPTDREYEGKRIDVDFGAGEDRINAIETVIGSLGANYHAVDGYDGQNATSNFSLQPRDILNIFKFLGVSGPALLEAERTARGATGKVTYSDGFNPRRANPSQYPDDERHVAAAARREGKSQFPDQDLTIQMLRNLAGRDLARFNSVMVLAIGERPITGYQPPVESVALYRRFKDGNFDPQILARQAGFDASTVELGGSYEGAGYYPGPNIGEGKAWSRGAMLGLLADEEDLESVKERLFGIRTRSPEEIQAAKDFTAAQAPEGYQPPATQVNRGFYNQDTVRQMASMLRDSMPYNVEALASSNELHGQIIKTLEATFDDNGRQLSGYGQANMDFFGERIQFSDSGDIFGDKQRVFDESLSSRVNTDIETNFGAGFSKQPSHMGGAGMSLESGFGESDALRRALSGGGGIAEPMGGDPLLGQGGIETLGEAQRRGPETTTFEDEMRGINKWSNITDDPNMNVEDTKTYQQQIAYWGMGLYGEDAIANGTVPKWGVLDPATRAAHQQFVWLVFQSDSHDKTIVARNLYAEAKPLFDALEPGAEDIEKEFVSRDAVSAEFSIASDETLISQIQEIASRGADGIGERLTSAAVAAIKALIRGAENAMIDQSFGQKQHAADQDYERRNYDARRREFDLQSSGQALRNQYGEKIGSGANPNRSGTVEDNARRLGQPQRERLGNLGFVDQVIDPSTGQPYGQGGVDADPTNLQSDALAGTRPGGLDQQDSFAAIEAVDPIAIIRQQMRKTQGDKVLARKMGQSLDVLSEAARGVM